jgi:beta-glucosidase/6-phospho-beta-glucosidase/beta-galactosidase/ABC-type amino acid transport substrate-binding protein
MLGYKKVTRSLELTGTLAPFPPSPAFRFGVATADHQCEAYVEAWDDVRDVFDREGDLQQRGRATEFWTRYAEDARLAQGLGCTAFRISLAWARLEPVAGVFDDAVFAHYAELLATLHSLGLAPVVTLLHNTWPKHVEQAGGMLDPGFPQRFERYAREVAVRLGERIASYVTINEPNMLVFGYIKPWWQRSYAAPPGLAHGATTGDQIGRVATLIPRLFEAHALAYAAIHEERPGAQVGANPLLFGFPRWLQRFLDRNATRLGRPSDMMRQGRRFTERRMLESGDADVTLAQLTYTRERSASALFTEAYYVASLALLARSAPPPPDGFASWRGTIAVARGSTAVDEAALRFPRAAVATYADVAAAAAALRTRAADLVLDDDVTLEGLAGTDLHVARIDGTAQPYAAAVAPGNRDLLGALDDAIRAFKTAGPRGATPWNDAMRANGVRGPDASPPATLRRGNAAALTGASAAAAAATAPTFGSSALARVRKNGTLRVAVRPGVPGLCMRTGRTYSGLEPDLARFMAERLCGSADAVRFVDVAGPARIDAIRSPLLRRIDPVLRACATLSTILTTNWWSLGQAGLLPEFLCKGAWTDTLDFVGLDYYWGIRNLGLHRIADLLASATGNYASAPVYPGMLRHALVDHAKMFPGKPLIVIENGCVERATNVDRATYVVQHVREVQRAVARGVPVIGYLCWSITTNREWGLRFAPGNDFGLYHIDLDAPGDLTRSPTLAAVVYRTIVERRSAV